MNLDTDCAPDFDDQLTSAYKPRRRMRVRHSYPASLIELVGHLRARMPARDIASALDIPLSSIYRWAPIPNVSSTLIDSAVDEARNWEPLIARCKADGFSVPQSIVETLASKKPRLPKNASLQRYMPSMCAHPQRAADSAPAVATEPSNLEAARSMIDREYFRDIDSNVLAAAARLSRFRFIHAFTERYNISPHQYLLRTRLAAAKRLLATSRETIDVIAAATGFRSGACLNRAFTRVEGHSVSRACRIISTRA